MNFFTSTAGCVFSSGGLPNQSFYKFDPDIGGNGRILINGGEVMDGDILMPAVTLAQDKILYTFGPDWGHSSINGVVLLGEYSDGGSILNTLLSWFETNRASKKSTPIQLSIPGKHAYSVFVHRLVIGSPMEAYNIQPFSIQLLVAGSA